MNEDIPESPVNDLRALDLGSLTLPDTSSILKTALDRIIAGDSADSCSFNQSIGQSQPS